MNMFQSVANPFKGNAPIVDKFVGFTGTSLTDQVFNSIGWIIDSGASNHMSSDLTLFKSQYIHLAKTLCYIFAYRRIKFYYYNWNCGGYGWSCSAACPVCPKL